MVRLKSQDDKNKAVLIAADAFAAEEKTEIGAFERGYII